MYSCIHIFHGCRHPNWTKNHLLFRAGVHFQVQKVLLFIGLSQIAPLTIFLMLPIVVLFLGLLFLTIILRLSANIVQERLTVCKGLLFVIIGGVNAWQCKGLCWLVSGYTMSHLLVLHMFRGIFILMQNDLLFSRIINRNYGYIAVHQESIHINPHKDSFTRSLSFFKSKLNMNHDYVLTAKDLSITISFDV